MKLEVNGKQVDVKQVIPLREEEPWNTYELPDGTRLRMKTVARIIFQVVGTDEYVIQSTNIMSTDRVK